jgi:hypothetical protein
MTIMAWPRLLLYILYFLLRSIFYYNALPDWPAPKEEKEEEGGSVNGHPLSFVPL